MIKHTLIIWSTTITAVTSLSIKKMSTTKRPRDSQKTHPFQDGILNQSCQGELHLRLRASISWTIQPTKDVHRKQNQHPPCTTGIPQPANSSMNKQSNQLIRKRQIFSYLSRTLSRRGFLIPLYFFSPPLDTLYTSALFDSSIDRRSGRAAPSAGRASPRLAALLLWPTFFRPSHGTICACDRRTRARDESRDSPPAASVLTPADPGSSEWHVAVLGGPRFSVTWRKFSPLPLVPHGPPITSSPASGVSHSRPPTCRSCCRCYSFRWSAFSVKSPCFIFCPFVSFELQASLAKSPLQSGLPELTW